MDMISVDGSPFKMRMMSGMKTAVLEDVSTLKSLDARVIRGLSKIVDQVVDCIENDKDLENLS